MTDALTPLLVYLRNARHIDAPPPLPFEWIVAYMPSGNPDEGVANAWAASAYPDGMIDLWHDDARAVRIAAAIALAGIDAADARYGPNPKLRRHRPALTRLARGERQARLPADATLYQSWIRDDWQFARAWTSVRDAFDAARLAAQRRAGRYGARAPHHVASNALMPTHNAWREHLHDDKAALAEIARRIRAHVPAPTAADIGFAL